MDNFPFLFITCFVMDDLTLYLYTLKSPVDLRSLGYAPVKGLASRAFNNAKIVSRTKEEGYALSAWLLVKGLDVQVLCIDGDRTKIPIVEDESIFLTWKPQQKPEVWFDIHNPLSFYLLARPPL